jgi:hypothetical protein
LEDLRDFGRFEEIRDLRDSIGLDWIGLEGRKQKMEEGRGYRGEEKE